MSEQLGERNESTSPTLAGCLGCLIPACLVAGCFSLVMVNQPVTPQPPSPASAQSIDPVQSAAEQIAASTNLKSVNLDDLKLAKRTTETIFANLLSRPDGLPRDAAMCNALMSRFDSDDVGLAPKVWDRWREPVRILQVEIAARQSGSAAGRGQFSQQYRQAADIRDRLLVLLISMQSAG